MLQSTKHRLSTRCNCCMVPFAATAVSRRELLAGGAAALAIGTAAAFAPTVFAQATPHRIDVHHHVSPPTWLDAVKSMKKDNPPMVSWSVQKSLDDMDKGGVSATAITSPTTPQVIGLALTAFADRFLVQAISRPPYSGKVTRATVDGELKRFYYDTAQVANNVTLAAMAQLMPISQIVYGTDFPYRTAADDTKGVTEFFKGDDLKAVDRENVIRLMPRLKTI
jgi:hypothetical protein